MRIFVCLSALALVAMGDMDSEADQAMCDALSDLSDRASSHDAMLGFSESSGESQAFDMPSTLSDASIPQASSPKRRKFVDVFNEKCVLRQRDTVVAKGTKKRKKAKPDLRRWRISSVLRRAFALETHLQGMQRSAHSSDRLVGVAVSFAMQESEERAFHERVVVPILRRPATEPWPYLIVLKKCDEQSATIRVDQAFSGELLKWSKEKFTGWGVFTPAEIQKLLSESEHSRVHVLNVMSQRCWATWGPGPNEHHEFLCRPSVLQRQNWICVGNSLDRAVRGLGYADLFKLARHVAFLILLACTDSAGSMIKCFANVSATSPRNVLVARTACDLHQMARIQGESLAAQGHMSFHYFSSVATS